MIKHLIVYHHFCILIFGIFLLIFLIIYKNKFLTIFFKTGIFIIFFPIMFMSFLYIFNNKNIGNTSDWLGFLGGYFGIIGAIGGIWWQLNETKKSIQKQLDEENNKNKIKILKKILSYLLNISNSLENIDFKMNIFYTSIFTDKFPYTEEKILLDEFEIKNFKDVIIEYFLIYNDNSFQKIIKTIEHLESLHLNLDDINSIKRDFLKATEFILEFHSKNNKELNDHIEPIFDNIFELTRYTEDCNDHFIKLNGIYNKKYNIDKTPSSPNSPITLEEFNKILELISSLSNLIKIADHPDKMTHYIIVNKYCHHIKKVIPLIHQCEDNFNIYSLENLKKLLEEKKNIISDEIKKLS